MNAMITYVEGNPQHTTSQLISIYMYITSNTYYSTDIW